MVSCAPIQLINVVVFVLRILLLLGEHIRRLTDLTWAPTVTNNLQISILFQLPILPLLIVNSHKCPRPLPHVQLHCLY